MNKNLFNKFLFLSFGIFGLTALIYQVAFAKNLVLLFGLTAPAIATVLAVYFSGLAIGSFFFGKLADRLIQGFKHHLLYVGLFVLVGIYGFLVPNFFQILEKIIQGINQIHPLDFSGFNFFAFLFSFCFLILPAIFIGGGFPIISKIFVRESETLGKKISILYFVNTLGGVFGALFAGFWLIPIIGVKMTIFTASSLNLVIAGLLIFFLKLSQKEILIENPPPKQKVTISKGIEGPLGNNLFIYILFLTGFLALALEVFYTKTLILFLGSSTYAFSLVLIIFLLGIALGSLVISPYLDRFKRGFFFFGLFSGLLGFWLFLTLKLFEKIPFLYLKIFQLFEVLNFSVMIFTQSLLLIFVILPATFLMGIIFPLGIKLASPNLKKIGEGTGKLYFANTLGGVLGSLAAGFFLLPVFGFQKSLIFILIIYILSGIFFIFKEKRVESFAKNLLLFFFVFLIIFSVFSSPWSKTILSMGIFHDMPRYFGLSEKEIKTNWEKNEILFYKEGLSQVMVTKRGNLLYLSINGKVDASNKDDLEPQILISALPLILHSDPKEVLIIGLGSGITLGAVTRFDSVKNIEAVEIDPKVIEAAQYFKEDNHNALSDPRVKIIIADAINYLYLTDKKYDVISSYPSNPWVSGNAYLFTKEFYELTRSHLRNGGLMLQWIPYYNFPTEDLKVVLGTFQEIFPKTYLFGSISTQDLILIGSGNEDSILSFEEIQKKLENEKIQKELERIHIENFSELLAGFLAGDSAIKGKVAKIKIHTNDRPFLEFSAPRALYQKTTAENLEFFGELKRAEKESEKLPKFFSGLDEKEILRQSDFLENWIFSQIAISTNDLEKALNFCEKAHQTGISNPLLKANLHNLYLIKAQKLEREGKKKEAEEFFQKADSILI